MDVQSSSSSQVAVNAKKRRTKKEVVVQLDPKGWTDIAVFPWNTRILLEMTAEQIVKSLPAELQVLIS